MNAARLLDSPGLLPEVRRTVDDFEKDTRQLLQPLVPFEPHVRESACS
jgi:hypothetical protein